MFAYSASFQIYCLCVNFITAVLFCLVEVCFEESNYEIIETDGPLKIRLELDKPAVEDTTILVFDIPETAIPGEKVVYSQL